MLSFLLTLRHQLHIMISNNDDQRHDYRQAAVQRGETPAVISPCGPYDYPFASCDWESIRDQKLPLCEYQASAHVRYHI